jgi:hypothetical protein
MSPNKSPRHFIIGIVFLCLLKSTNTKKLFLRVKIAFAVWQSYSPHNLRSPKVCTSYYPRKRDFAKGCTSYYPCKLDSARVGTFYPRKLDFAKVCTSYYPRNLALHNASQFTIHFQGQCDHNYAINLYLIFFKCYRYLCIKCQLTVTVTRRSPVGVSQTT